MRRKQQGFSLVEIMIVMAIVIALGYGGVQGWRQWQQRLQLWQTTQQLASFLERLRYHANGSNTEHFLWLKQQGDSWCIGSSGSKKTPCALDDDLQFTPAFEGIMPDEITPGLGFFGLRNTAWPGHIVLKSVAGKTKLIVSVWGRIRICELSRETSCK